MSQNASITVVELNTCYSCKSSEMISADQVNMTLSDVLIQAFVFNGNVSENGEYRCLSFTRHFSHRSTSDASFLHFLLKQWPLVPRINPQLLLQPQPLLLRWPPPRHPPPRQPPSPLLKLGTTVLVPTPQSVCWPTLASGLVSDLTRYTHKYLTKDC